MLAPGTPSGADQIDSLLKALSSQLNDLPAEKRNRIEADLQKVRDCVSDLIHSETQGGRAAEPRPGFPHTELFFDHLQESALVYEVVRDEAGTIIDWYFRDANTAALRVLHLQRGDLVGKTASQLLGTEAVRKVAAELTQVLTTGEPCEREEQFGERHFHVSLFRIDANTAARIATDITKQKQAEAHLRRINEALAASEAGYRDLAESISDGFFELNQEWRFTFINRRAASNIGLNQQDLIGKNLWEAFPALLGTTAEKLYRQVMESRQPTDFEIPGVLSGNWYSVRVYPSPRGIAVFWIDITERKKAEAALLASEVKFAKAFQSNTHSLAISRLQDGKYIEVNDSFLNLVGYTREELMGHTSLELEIISPADRAEMARLLQATGSIRDYPFQFKKKSGEMRYGITSIEPIEVGDEMCVLTSQIDITERKLAEESLQAAYHELMNERNRLFAVMEALPVGIALLDAQGGVVQHNKGFEELWGSPPPKATSVDDYLAYQAWWADTGQPLRPEDWAGALTVQEGETVIGQFLQIRRFDGRRAYILNSGAPIRDASGKITGSAVAEMDITQWIEVENALRETQDRLRVALNSVPLLVFTCDSELRYTWTSNPQQGFLTNDFLGKRDDEILPPEAAAELIAAKQQALTSGQGGVQEVKVPLHGEDTYHILTIDPIRDPQGSVIGLTCAALEITDQKRMQAEQQEQAIQLEVQRRLMDHREQDRSATARDLHDGPIQTLSSSMFHLQMIKELFPDATLQLELNQLGLDIRNTIHELRTIMNDLRPPALVTFGFSKVIQLYTEDFHSRFPELEIELDVTADDRLLPAQTHLSLYRIFQAGINNIVRHSDASKAWVVYRIEQDRFVFEMRDNGMGFELNKDFSRLTRDGHFGLAGMKERAEAMNAEFSIISEPGFGTTIVVKGPIDGIDRSSPGGI